MVMAMTKKKTPPAPPSSPSSPLGYGAVGLTLALLVSMGVVVLPVLLDSTIAMPGHDWFIGADTYMRMVRVEGWWRGADWYANVSVRSNWPFGETLHWTRPLDMLLVALAWPLMAVMEEARAFYWAGQALSPLLALATMITLVVASRGLLGFAGRVALPFLFVIQPLSRSYFEPGRPDHHSVLLFLFVVAFALLASLCRARPNDEPTTRDSKTAAALGVAIGLAVWVGPEAMATAFFVYAFFGLAWLYRGNDARWLSRLRITAWSALATLTLALMIERPPDEWLVAVEYDRLSIVQWTLFAAAAVANEALFRAARLASTLNQTLGGRIFLAVVAGAFVVAVMAAVFPVFLQGPFKAVVDARLHALWLDNVVEVTPLLRPDDPFTLARTARIATPAFFIGMWLWLAWRGGGKVHGTQAGLLAFGGALYLALTFYQVRWAAYFAVPAAVGWAAVLEHTLGWKGGPLVAGGKVPLLRAPLVALIVLAPFGGAWMGAEIGARWAVGMATAELPHPRAQCPWVVATGALNDLSAELGRPLVIFAQIHQGPEILYRTRHRVIGTPYHRNTAGIVDTAAVFMGENMAEVRGILNRRAVDVVAICADNVEQRHYLKAPGDTLMRRLVEANPPEWLKKMALPSDGQMRLYRLRRGP